MGLVATGLIRAMAPRFAGYWLALWSPTFSMRLAMLRMVKLRGATSPRSTPSQVQGRRQWHLVWRGQCKRRQTWRCSRCGRCQRECGRGDPPCETGGWDFPG